MLDREIMGSVGDDNLLFITDLNYCTSLLLFAWDAEKNLLRLSVVLS